VPWNVERLIGETMRRGQQDGWRAAGRVAEIAGAQVWRESQERSAVSGRSASAVMKSRWRTGVELHAHFHGRGAWADRGSAVTQEATTTGSYCAVDRIEERLEKDRNRWCGVTLELTHKNGHSFRERNHSEEKRYSRKFQRMAVARMETCEDVVS